jgi:hypothetical protein
MNPLITKVFVNTSILLISMICFLTAEAQKKESSIKRFYFQAGVGATTNSGFLTDLSLQAITTKNWVTSLTYSKVEMDPKNLPSDYIAGYEGLFFEDPIPTETFTSVSLTAGKAFQTGRNTWFTTEGGIAYVNGESMSFYPQTVESDFFSATSNYSTTTTDKSAIGGVIKADFNWAFASFMGLGAGVNANLNSIQSLVGFRIKLLVGKMGREKKNSKQNL